MKTTKIIDKMMRMIKMPKMTIDLHMSSMIVYWNLTKVMMDTTQIQRRQLWMKMENKQGSMKNLCKNCCN